MRTELRPLTLGELLDRTFQLYRTYFQLFVGIAAVGASINLVWAAIETFSLRALNAHGPSVGKLQVISIILQFVSVAISMIIFSLIWGAMVRTVAAIYRGEPTGISEAIRSLLPHWVRLAFVTLCAYLAPWLPVMAGFAVITLFASRLRVPGGSANPAAMVVVGFAALALLLFVPIGIWLSLRYLLSNAVSAFENTNLVQSMRRSAVLGKGMRGRLFMLVVVAGLMQVVIVVIFTLPVWIPFYRNPIHPPLWTIFYGLLSGVLSTALTTPILGISVALFYFDARIRKEGLDIEWSLQPASTLDSPFVPATPHRDLSAG